MRVEENMRTEGRKDVLLETTGGAAANFELSTQKEDNMASKREVVG